MAGKNGRPAAVINLDDVERIVSSVMNCADTELADQLGVHEDTIKRRRKSDPEFARVLDRAKRKARYDLHKAQFDTAKGGNPTMQIWLGKQYLGQTDATRHEFSGVDGKPIELKHDSIAERTPEQIGAILDVLAGVGAIPGPDEGRAGSTPKPAGPTKH